MSAGFSKLLSVMPTLQFWIAGGAASLLATCVYAGPDGNAGLNKSATQDSTYYNLYYAQAGRAVDGNIDGYWHNNSTNSIAHTGTPAHNYPWWQVDLGSIEYITEIKLYNRQDSCCISRAQDYDVIISDTPVTGAGSPSTSLGVDPVGSTVLYQAAIMGRPTTIPVNTTGRYVRIRLRYSSYINLAEAMVMSPTPDAYDDAFTTEEAVAVSGNLIADNGNGADSDPQGTAVTTSTTPVVAPAHGSVVINTDGSFTYTPVAGFVGTDTFTYTLVDTVGLTDTAVATITVTPALSLIKTVSFTGDDGDGIAEPGELITYTFTVKNIGSHNIFNVTLPTEIAASFTGDFALLGTPVKTSGGANLDGGGPLNDLAPAEVMVFSGTYPLTQADIDLGYVDNQAKITATGPYSAVEDLSHPTDETLDGLTRHTITQVKTMTVEKTANFIVDAGADGLAEAGDIIRYQYKVTNTGNVTLTNINLADVANGRGASPDPANETLTDAAPLGDSSDTIANDGVWSSLAPNDWVTMTWDYTAVQADVDELQ